MGATFVSRKTYDSAPTGELSPGHIVITWPVGVNLLELSDAEYEDLLYLMGEVAGCDLSCLPSNDDDVWFADEAVARGWAEQLRAHQGRFDGEDRELVEEAILFFSTCEDGLAAV